MVKIKCAYNECKYKVNTYLIDSCKCNHYYCKYHRLPFEHSCSFQDKIKTDNQEQIKIQNPKIKKDTWNLKNI